MASALTINPQSRPVSVLLPASISAVSTVAMLSLAAFAVACIGHTTGFWVLTVSVAAFATAGAAAWLPTAIIASVLAIVCMVAFLPVLNASHIAAKLPKAAVVEQPLKPPRRVRFAEDPEGPSRPAPVLRHETPGEFSQTAYEEALWLKHNGQQADTVVYTLPHNDGMSIDVVMSSLAADGAFVDRVAVPAANSSRRKLSSLEAIALSEFLRTPSWENLLAFSDTCGKQGLDTWGLEPLLAYTHEDWKASCLRPGAWTARAQTIVLKCEAMLDHDSWLLSELKTMIARRAEMEIFAFLEQHESSIPPEALVVQTWSSLQKGKNVELPHNYFECVRKRLGKHFGLGA